MRSRYPTLQLHTIPTTHRRCDTAMACQGNNVNTALCSSSVATAAAAAAIVLPFIDPTLLWLSQHTLAASVTTLAADRIAVGWSVSCTSVHRLLLMWRQSYHCCCCCCCWTCAPAGAHQMGMMQGTWYQRECRSCTASAVTHRQRV
jgi:hypothetical protein